MGRHVSARAARRTQQKASGELIPNDRSRGMARQMQQMGMNLQEIPSVEEVVIKHASGEIILRQPQVSLIKQKGLEIYQVVGQSEQRNMDESTVEGRSSGSSSSAQPYVIPEADITLVAAQANVSLEQARKALEENQGDLARAILALRT